MSYFQSTVDFTDYIADIHENNNNNKQQSKSHYMLLAYDPYWLQWEEELSTWKSS